MEINIGDYVRTKKSGYIGKIYNINEFREPNTIYALDIPRADDYVFMGKDDFISSKDIIDLIEVGDVIEFRIDNVSLSSKGYIKGITNIDDEEMLKQLKKDKNYHVLSILTKEQFEQNTYRIGNEIIDDLEKLKEKE